MHLADRVKETTTTTGTGAYTLAGPVTGYRGFVAAFGTQRRVHYVCEMGADWEIGLGLFTDGAPDTMARTTIFASSNAGAAVNWAAGEKTIYCAPTARALLGCLGREHQRWSDVADMTRMGYGTLCKMPTSVAHGWSNQGMDGDFGEHQHVAVGLAGETTDATPLIMLIGDPEAAGEEIVLPTYTAVAFEIDVVAFDTTTPAAKGWKIQGVVRSGSSTASSATIAGTPIITETGEEASTTSWAVAVSGQANNTFRLEVTGQIAKTIIWSAYVRMTHVASYPVLP